MRAREQALIPYYDQKLVYYSTADEPHLSQILQRCQAPTQGRMLDAGCGDGRAAGWAAAHGLEYVGVDYSAARVAKARRLYPGEFLVGDLYDTLASRQDEFDLLICFEVLEHLEEPAEVVARLQRLRRPGGLIVATVPVQMPYVSHLQVYADEEDVRRRLQPQSCFRYGTGRREHFVLTW